ncbi:MAG: SDR family oxidoreductase [Alphaproteobacteria bacterium]|jgi:NADP-dependent 3-hydroxy acid dehydrogenase YdfG|nr:SDR family oxidoreductase [Alphaproteobacteria bacterium]
MNKKLVVITGASSGIGLAIAKTFSKQGHPLLLLARRIERLQDLNLPNTLCKKVDVRDLESFTNAIAEAEKIYGDVDLLVNNAGLMQLGDVIDQDVNEWNNMVDVNLKGVFNGCHIVVNKMVANKHGTIINMSSIAGKKATAGRAVYNATKFGVSAFTESLRQEVHKDNVRVIAICPGIVATELQGHTTSKKYKESLMALANNPQTALQPQDIADTVSYVYNVPQNVCVRDLVITPTDQER